MPKILKTPTRIAAALALLAFLAGCASDVHQTRLALDARKIDWRSPDALPDAVDAGNVKLVEALLRAKVNPNKLDHDAGTLKPHRKLQSGQRDSENLLVRAVNRGETQIAALLLDYGASPTVKDTDGSTVLCRALVNNEPEIAAKIIQKCSTRFLNEPDKEGDTALMTALLLRHGDIAKLLLDRGAHINVLDCRKDTPLLLAVREKQFGVAVDLIYRGANVNAANRKGETPLMWATEHNNSWLAGILLANGADINAKDRRGLTALGRGVKEGRDETVAFLLRIDELDLKATDNYGNSALDLALKNNRENMVSQIKNRLAGYPEKQPPRPPNWEQREELLKKLPKTKGPR